MSNIAIEFNHVGKQYRLGTVGTGTLSHDLNRWWQTSILGKEDPYLKIGDVNDRSSAATSDYVWALRDIDFKVEQGDVVGIIGKNGAGKSTLLKLLSRVTGPTVGTINAKGRIASLLEVGTGFHGEMTGRENIYLNGAILGMTKQEINAKLDEIVAFSGCEKYIDTPVKRYSSGMTVRLGFAVAAFLEPEILVVDEVLAVGDAEFQKKAIGKMQDVAGNGRTVLFVSHNMASVRTLCSRGVLLENGGVKLLGSVTDVVESYLKSNDMLSLQNIVEKITWIDSRIKIDEIKINGSSQSISCLSSKQKYVDLEISGSTTETLSTEVALIFRNEEECALASFSYSTSKQELLSLSGKFCIKTRILLPEMMYAGKLFLDLYFHQPKITFLLKAPKCCMIESEGFQNPFGQVTLLKRSGLMELSCTDVD